MKRSPLLPIFLVVLVDILGFTIVYPLLPYYAEHLGATPLIATLLVSVYALCSLLSTPVIGRLSDQFGRRRLLMISQAGTCAGFIVLAFSNAVWMLFLGRILDGLTAGNLSTAQAYISDHTLPENRAKAFGVIGIAFGIGFTFGPGMAGLLAPHGEHLPFVVAACLSVGSMICTYTLLEPGAPARQPGADPAAAPGGKRPGLFDVATYLDFFKRPAVGATYLQFFMFSFAFSSFMSGFALFAERRFTTSAGHAWSAHEVGYLFAYSGVLGIILQGGILGRLVKRFGETKVSLAGFLSVALAYAQLGFTGTVTLLVLVTTVSAFGNGVLRPVLTSMLTQQVGRHEQGTAIGISSSLSSFAMMIAPPVCGALIENHWLVAWALVPATTAALGLLVALRSYRPREKQSAGGLPTATARPAEPTSTKPID